MRKCVMAAIAAIVAATSAQAAVINDGTTTGDLTLVVNPIASTASLTVTGALGSETAQMSVASVAGQPSGAARNAFAYESTAQGLVTSKNYTASAECAIGGATGAGQAGLVGWFDPATGKGIGLLNAAYSGGARVGVYQANGYYMNPTVNNAAQTVVYAGLFSSTGTAITADRTLGFTLTEANATYEMTFAAPSAADLAINSGFTTKITAKIVQGANTWTDTFFTTLAAPSDSDHRIGYAGGGYISPSTIQFDNLSLTVPEPASLAVIGLAGLTLMARRRAA